MTFLEFFVLLKRFLQESPGESRIARGFNNLTPSEKEMKKRQENPHGAPATAAEFPDVVRLQTGDNCGGVVFGDDGGLKGPHGPTAGNDNDNTVNGFERDGGEDFGRDDGEETSSGSPFLELFFSGNNSQDSEAERPNGESPRSPTSDPDTTSTSETAVWSGSSGEDDDP